MRNWRASCARGIPVLAPTGLNFWSDRPNGEFFLRLFNADGSEAELSGNGTRCVAAWLAQKRGQGRCGPGHAWRSAVPVRLSKHADPLYLIESEMGVPRVMPRTIEVPGVGNVAGAMVNVGNPHFVLFVESEDFSAHGLRWQELGEQISTSPLFPHGTNVEFVRVLSPSEIAFRIYERGCGPTTSSGTGTCASSAAAMVLRGGDRELTATAEGGAQRVVWSSNDAVMRLTGPAEIICRGEVAAL